MTIDKGKALQGIILELDRQIKMYPEGIRSPHEGYGILCEEMKELLDEIHSGDPLSQQVEALQIAAVALRYVMCAEAWR